MEQFVSAGVQRTRYASTMSHYVEIEKREPEAFFGAQRRVPRRRRACWTRTVTCAGLLGGFRVLSRHNCP
jgi:hypothetical protein